MVVNLRSFIANNCEPGMKAFIAGATGTLGITKQTRASMTTKLPNYREALQQ
jgi:hypothetical protein